MKKRDKEHSVLTKIFSSQQAENGGVVRGSVVNLLKHVSESEIEAAVERRKFHVFECGGQYIFICNQGVLRTIS